MLFKLRFYPTPRTSSGFTIVELLITIVIIGVLATITAISYVGISNKANVTAIQSDLVTSYESLKIYQIQNSNYPTSITDCPVPATGNLCIKPSGSNIIASYVKDNTISPKGFCVNITNGNDSYKITSTTYKSPIPGDCVPPPPVTVNYATPGSNTWTVPSGVSSVQLEAWGAQGSGSDGGVGGKGGYSKGDLAVTSGQTLYIYVGGFDGYNGGGAGGAGGGSGDNGGNGGGASDIRLSGAALGNRVIIAGGGGGAGGWGPYGGAGGGTSGLAGVSGGSTGGNGGTQSTGYSIGIGENGGSTSTEGGGGGGGGGYYGGYGGGGGSSGEGAGGGGGSGYVGGVTSTTLTAGNLSMPAPGGGNETGHSGDGYVRIIYTPNMY